MKFDRNDILRKLENSLIIIENLILHPERTASLDIGEVDMTLRDVQDLLRWVGVRGVRSCYESDMSERTLLAGMAMCGLFSDAEFVGPPETIFAKTADDAVKFADALIERLKQ